MAVAVSVVVIARNFRSRLGALIKCLDQQSLSTTAFDVVFVDMGSSDGTAERLQQIVTHRPNMSLVELAEASGEDVTSWLSQCAGNYVIRLRPDQLLLPQALERMYALASQNDLHAVSARVSQPGACVPALFTVDQLGVDASSLDEALGGPAVLLDRSLLAVLADPQHGSLPAPTRVGVLASYPALSQLSDATRQGAGGSGLRQDQPKCWWVDDKLRVDVSGVVVSDSPASIDLSEAYTVAMVRHSQSGLSYLIQSGEPLTRDVSDERALWRWRLCIDIDLRTAALDSALSPGLWEIDIQLLGSTAPALAPITVAWAACPPAVLGATIVVASPPTASPSLQLDVGPTMWPVVADVNPAGATVTETAAGSLLVLPLPHVHVAGAEERNGVIALDQLRLRAKIITDGQAARVESYVSGLIGSPSLSTQFGDTPMKPSGLCLEISGLGEMVVAKAKPKAPAAKNAAPESGAAKKPAAKKPAAKKPAASPPAASKPGLKKADAGPVKRNTGQKSPSTLQILRRAVPSFLEPVATRVAKNPLARRLYRNAAKL